MKTWKLVVCAIVLSVLVSTLVRIYYSPRVESSDPRYNRAPALSFRRKESSSSLNQIHSEFKIVQIADIHLGEAQNLDWGPEQDRKTWIVLDNILTTEQPDLIVLSGDQLTANDCDANATAYYKLLGDRLSQYNTPWALIFGNHDDMDFEVKTPNGTIIKYPAKTSRHQLLQAHEEFRLSLTREGPPHVFGVSNYWLDIHHHALPEGSPAARILLLDSGGGNLTQKIDQSQIDRFLQTNDEHIPTFAFQHIPTSLNDFGYVQSRCIGENGDGGLAPVEFDAGILQVLADAGNVHWLAVGHNHGNDYCCSHSDKLHVCFGRHSGYGGYGNFARGARVFVLESELNYGSSIKKWSSWVRLESGEIIDRYNSSFSGLGN